MRALCATASRVGCRRAGFVQTGSRHRQRQTDHKNTSLSQAVAVGGNRAAVKIDDVLDDRKTETHPALSGRVVGALPESLEDIVERALVDSLAIVGDNNLEVRVDPLEPDLHLAAFGRELDGVGEQVPHRLLQPVRITHDHARARIDDDLHGDRFRFGRGTHVFNRRAHDLRGIDRLNIEAHLAALDPRDVQQILDELCLCLGAAKDRVDPLLGLALERSAGHQRVAPEQDRVERIAQFMGDHGEKIRLRLICRFGLLERIRKCSARSSNLSPCRPPSAQSPGSTRRRG